MLQGLTEVELSVGSQEDVSLQCTRKHFLSVWILPECVDASAAILFIASTVILDTVMC